MNFQTLKLIPLLCMIACVDHRVDTLDPIDVAFNALDSLEESWHVRNSWPLNDSTFIYIFDTGEDSLGCHSCGPKAALVKVVLKRFDSPQVVDVLNPIPVIAAWGELPEFKLHKLARRNVLSYVEGFGNHGNEYYTLKLIDLGFCNFGTVAFSYSYQGDFFGHSHTEELRERLAPYGIKIRRGEYVRWHLAMTYSMDSSSERLTVKHSGLEVQLEDAYQNVRTRVALGEFQKEYHPVLCSWGELVLDCT
jgi:hypothetical protein